MKLIIEIEHNSSANPFFCSRVPQELYDKFYKKDGWLFDKDTESIYHEVDIPFMPIEGQRLGTKYGIYIVKYSIYEMHQHQNSTYYDRSRVIVEEE